MEYKSKLAQYTLYGILGFALMIYLIRKYFVKKTKFIQLSNDEDNSNNNNNNNLDLANREHSFIKDLENGLNSNNFNIEENINTNDNRPGLKDQEEILEIMSSEGCTFDEARLIRQKKLFKLNNIDPETGIPLDSKFVTFDSLLGNSNNGWDNSDNN